MLDRLQGGQHAPPPDMVFLKKSSLTFGKASKADKVDHTLLWPAFCAMLGAASLLTTTQPRVQWSAAVFCLLLQRCAKPRAPCDFQTASW
jgi:hypothetical protein